jgi:YD repeat-containing protein
VYDALNRLTTETDPLSKLLTTAYDAVGHQTQHVDRLGRIRNFAYDALDRLTQETWVESGTTVNTLTHGFVVIGIEKENAIGSEKENTVAQSLTRDG